MIELFSFFPLASEGQIGRPDRTMRSGTDSQRGAEPISVKKSPFDCDAATTVEKANFRPFDLLRDATKMVEWSDVGIFKKKSNTSFTRPSPLPAHPDTRQSLPVAPAQAASPISYALSKVGTLINRGRNEKDRPSPRIRKRARASYFWRLKMEVASNDIPMIKWKRSMKEINEGRQRRLFWKLFALGAVGFGATTALVGWAINSILILLYG